MNRDFKGIWIPKEIWLSEKLTTIEKLFLAEIDSLDNERGCFAENQYFSEFFDLSVTRVSQIINSLVEKGYVESIIDKSNGNKRTLHTLLKFSLIPSPNKVQYPIKENCNSSIYNKDYKKNDNTHTHAAPDGASVREDKARVCVSDETQIEDPKVINFPNSKRKTRHTDMIINLYTRMQTPQLGNGWKVEAIKTGLYDEMIDSWLESQRLRNPDSRLQTPDSRLLTFNQAAQQIVSIRKILLPEHIPRFIDDLDVSDETREKLREEFLEKEIA